MESRASTSSRERMTDDVKALKDSFGQLRSDVAELLTNALDIGRTGKHVAKDTATDALDHLKSRVAEIKSRGASRFSSIERKIEDNPLPTAMVALAVGYMIAKLFGRD